MNMEFQDQVISFSEPLANSDQILVVEGQELHVHRAVLGLWSPVFRAMFNSDFKETAQEKIELPGKRAELFTKFLLLLYSPDDSHLLDDGWVKEEAYQSILIILDYAREYQTGKAVKTIGNKLLEYVREKINHTESATCTYCRKFISWNKESLQEKLETLMMLLHLADKFELMKVTDAVLPHLSYFRFTVVAADRRFELLSVDMKFKLTLQIAFQLEISFRTAVSNCKCYLENVIDHTHYKTFITLPSLAMHQ